MIDGALKRILACEHCQPIEILPLQLDALFRTLAETKEIAAAYHVEDEIWALWTFHADRDLRSRMDQAIAAVAGRRYADARILLDDIVRDAPLWPEAWNKRATLHFLLGDDPASIRDIERTLSMEPRHFGALSGFAQICLRHGRPDAALAAFEAVLRIHPSLPTVRLAVDGLSRPGSSTIH
jgi:tetratricopeptide (TPR) repeat protein